MSSSLNVTMIGEGEEVDIDAYKRISCDGASINRLNQQPRQKEGHGRQTNVARRATCSILMSPLIWHTISDARTEAELVMICMAEPDRSYPIDISHQHM